MAVLCRIYGKTEPEYVGCVLDTYEHNGPWDSDWYAICWDDERQKVVHIEYDTTRAGGGGYADVDATHETLLKVYRHYKKEAASLFDEVENQQQAKKVMKGDAVLVIRGRKVKKGTKGNVFWVGNTFNYYSGRTEKRVGIEVGGERLFLPLEYVEVIGWENRLITGKERKEHIRNIAINQLPARYRSMFENRKYNADWKNFRLSAKTA
jgi:hypothetical protein